MKKPILRMMVGLPASGKSTEASDLVDNSTPEQTWVQVEKDIIRKDASLFEDGAYNHKRGDEAIVIRERNRQIREALRAGNSVVVSDTNLDPKHRGQLRMLATECDVDFEVDDSFLDVSVEECLKRDEEREHSVGANVILDMYYKYVHPGFHQRRSDWKDKLPRAFLCDIDGTLAHNLSGRGWYDLDEVKNDTPNYALTHLFDAVDLFRDEYSRKHTKYTHIILLSGRKEGARAATEAWLDHWSIPYDELIMRADNDNREDFITKKELYEEHIKGKYNVLAVFDDRPQVVDMWRRDLGLMVFQAADHDLKF